MNHANVFVKIITLLYIILCIDAYYVLMRAISLRIFDNSIVSFTFGMHSGCYHKPYAVSLLQIREKPQISLL